MHAIRESFDPFY